MKINWKKVVINPYTISLILFILLVIGIFYGTFSYFDTYTNHGQQIEVPNLADLTVDEAEVVLKQSNLKCTVVDSVFMKNKKLGVVVEQTPLAGAFVKEGRTIYLITNSNSIRKVVMPDVREVSLRQAEATINSVGFKVDSIEYVPSEYKDLVLNVRLGNKILEPGARIPEGSSITLLVGRGDSNEEIETPSFRGLNLEQAISKAHAAYLNIGEAYYDVKPQDEKDKDSYFIYKQKAITGTIVPLGESINVYLTKDPTLLEIPEEKQSEEHAETSIEEL